MQDFNFFTVTIWLICLGSILHRTLSNFGTKSAIQDSVNHQEDRKVSDISLDSVTVYSWLLLFFFCEKGLDEIENRTFFQVLCDMCFSELGRGIIGSVTDRRFKVYSEANSREGMV